MKIQYTLRIYKHLHRKSNVYDIFDFLQLKKNLLELEFICIYVCRWVYQIMYCINVWDIWRFIPSEKSYFPLGFNESIKKIKVQILKININIGLLVRLVWPCEQLTTYSPGNSCFHQRFEKLCHRVNSAIQSISRS